jgi:hypothetical protein
VIGLSLYVAIATIFGTVLVGMVLKWVVACFIKSDRDASIASFSACLGNGIPAILLNGPFDFDGIIEKVGSIVGLNVLWWCLFKREVSHG